MPRVIVRYSLNGTDTQPIHTKLTNLLNGRGLTKVGTAAWEGPDTRMAEALETLAEVVSVLSRYSGKVDHLWAYVDRAKTVASKP